MNPTTVAHRLLADLPGIPVAGDDPTVLERWTRGRSFDSVAADVIADQPDRLELVRLLCAPDFGAMLICSSAHPYLEHLVDWVNRQADLLLVASPSGPPPPAVFIYTGPRVS